MKNSRRNYEVALPTEAWAAGSEAQVGKLRGSSLTTSPPDSYRDDHLTPF